MVKKCLICGVKCIIHERDVQAKHLGEREKLVDHFLTKHPGVVLNLLKKETTAIKDRKYYPEVLNL